MEDYLRKLDEGVEKWNQWRRRQFGHDEPELIRVDLKGRNFAGINLSRCFLVGACLDGCNLEEADFRGAALDEASLIGANLRWAKLDGASLRQTNLSDADCSYADFGRADLDRTLFENTELKEADLTGIDLQKTSLYYHPNWAHVQINVLDEKLTYISIARLLQAVEDFMREHGFERQIGLMPKRGSWIHTFYFKLKRWIKGKPKREVAEIYEEMKDALRAEFIEKTKAEAHEKQSIAAHNLAKALEMHKNVIIKMGELVAVKRTNQDGSSSVIIGTVGADFKEALKKDHTITQDPDKIIQYMSDRTPIVIKPSKNKND